MALPKPGTISKDNYLSLLKSNYSDTIFVGVRTKEEFEAGSFPGAINVSVEQIKENLDKLPKDKKVITICASGVKAEIAYNILKDSGYDVKYLDSFNEFTGGLDPPFLFSSIHSQILGLK